MSNNQNQLQEDIRKENLELKEALQQKNAEIAFKDRALKIETALEKVRARTMAMKKSDELQDAASIMFQQLEALGINTWSCGYNIFQKDDDVCMSWMSNKGQMQPPFQLPLEGNETFTHFKTSKQKGEDFWTEELEGETIKTHYTYLFSVPGVQDILKVNEQNQLTFPSHQVNHIVNFSHGNLMFITYEQVPEAHDIFKRFGKTFEQTYTRFLDLQKAETQAKEAQIEVALERVRSRAMAMQTSEELNALIGTVFTELIKLDLSLTRCAILIYEADKKGLRQWMVNSETPSAPMSFFVPHTDLPYFNALMKGWHERSLQWEYLLEGENKIITDAFLFKETELAGLPDLVIAGMRAPEKVYISASFNNFGCVTLASLEPLSDEHFDIVLRFAKVFDLTYTRFNDLLQAEAQARQAQIEAALERVRNKAMAMNSSTDILATVGIVFTELKKLHINPIRSGVGIINKETRTVQLYSATFSDNGDALSLMGDVAMKGHPVFEDQYSNWLIQQNYFRLLQMDELTAYYKILSDGLRTVLHTNAETYPHQYGHWIMFSEGFIYAWSDKQYNEAEIAILERFKKVIEFTFTRYFDLQKAEAQAKDAELERQRSENLLLNILPLEIANELKQFGKSYARKHEQVTILFTDIKGFSTISETLSPEELVNQLDECFRAFDHIVDKHGLEKIKTIGDAYVCACGLPKPDPDNAIKTVKAAIDMLAFTKGFGVTKKIQDLPVFDFRFGIHTGPVVTGVVGLKKFTYDIWGDAVNMAARMEQHGEAGKINISGATYQLVKDKFSCTHRGKIEAKNKGMVDMYFVD